MLSDRVYRRVLECAAAAACVGTTKGHMWGYPVFVLGAVCSFLEPFCGHLSPNIANVSEKLTLRYPHERPWVGARERIHDERVTPVR